jgi:hypothetical protein
MLRSGLIALGFLGVLSLSACSGLTPVYGERGLVAERQAFQYADPKSRLEQIIYQELVLRFGRSTDPNRPLVRITTSTGDAALTKSDVRRPSDARQATVTAVIVVVDANGKQLLNTTRSAAVPYMSDDNQALAASEAERSAYEQAARALAETIRLTLLGALSQTAL